MLLLLGRSVVLACLLCIIPRKASCTEIEAISVGTSKTLTLDFLKKLEKSLASREKKPVLSPITTLKAKALGLRQEIGSTHSPVVAELSVTVAPSLNDREMGINSLSDFSLSKQLKFPVEADATFRFVHSTSSSPSFFLGYKTSF